MSANEEETRNYYSYEIVEGLRKNSRLYKVENRLYYRNRETGGKIFLRCQLSEKLECPGRGFIDKTLNKFVAEGTHNHKEDAFEFDLRSIKLKLKNEASLSSRTMRAVFNDVCRSFPKNISSKIKFPSVARAMYNSRRKKCYSTNLPSISTGQGPSSQGYSAQQVNTLGVWNSPATASSVNFMRRQQQQPPQNSMLQPTAAKLRRNQGKQFVNQHINIKNREPKTILHTVEPTLSSFTKTQEDLQTESKASILTQPVRQKENVLVFDEQEAVAKANSPDEGSQPREKEIYVVANHQHCIMSNLTFLWKNGKLCDAGISNGSTTVKVHKLILSAMCPKLLSVFNAEKFSKEFLMVNFPKEVSKEALKAFAEYMYEGILNLDCNILEQLKIIAKKLDMREFEQLCNSHLSSYIHIPDALSSSIPFPETAVQVADMFSSPTSIGSAIQDSAYSTASQIINIKQEITEAELDQVMKETAVVFGSDTNRTSVISDESINTDGIRISPNIKMEPVGSEDDKYGHLDPNNSNHGFTSTISSPPSVPAIKSTLTASIPESSLKFTIPFSHTTDLLENSVKLKTTPSYQENSLVSDFSSTPIIFNAASSQSNTLDKKNLSKSLNQPSDSSSSVELSLKSNGNHNTVYPVKLFTVKGDNLLLNKNN